MNKTALVISHFGFVNYGQRLQSVAVVEMLRSFGIESTVAAPYKHVWKDYLLDFARRSFPVKSLQRTVRYRRFYRFVSHYTPYKRMSFDSALDEAQQYGCCVIGSDQVWSPYFLARKQRPELYFLPDVPGEKKIALAPSFGVDAVPSEMKDFFKNGLRSFDRLSVREEAGARIIKNLVGVEATVLPDPTLGIQADRWREMASYSLCPKENYLLTYYLGDWNPRLLRTIESFASDNGLAIVHLMDREALVHSAGPAEFLGLIDAADYYVTDSFHGTALASILNTPFCVTKRVDSHGRDMFDRVDTLLASLGLEDRSWLYDSNPLPSNDVDWDGVNNKVALCRSKLHVYLQEELKRCRLL